MQLKTGIIIGLAFGLSGCATSPFLVSKEASYAPGFVPRNEMGEPVLPASGAAANPRTDDETASRKASAPQHTSWLNG